MLFNLPAKEHKTGSQSVANDNGGGDLEKEIYVHMAPLAVIVSQATVKAKR